MKDIDLLQPIEVIEASTKSAEAARQGTAITVYDEVDDSDTLTKNQQRALIVLSNLTDYRPEQEKAAELGVHRVTLWKWKRDPAFMKELSCRLDASFMANRDSVLTKLVELAIDGDIRAIQLFLTLSGDYITRSQSMNLSISARAQQEPDSLPRSPREKQLYLAKVLSETGFSVEEYCQMVTGDKDFKYHMAKMVADAGLSVEEYRQVQAGGR